MSCWGRFVATFVLVVVGVFVFAPALFSSAASAAQQGLNGTWDCCGAGGAAQQVFIMNDGTGTAVTPGGGTFATITDSDNGGNVKIVTTYSGSTYVATFVGTLAPDDQSMGGTWSSNANQSGTWSATRGTAVSTGPISVAMTVSPITFGVGQTSSCVVTVTAGSEALTNISLGSGLIIEGGFATVTSSPSLTAGSLAAGASQTFNFTLRGSSDGGELITVQVSADSATGAVSSSAESKYEVGTFTALPPTPDSGGPVPAAAPIASTLGTPGEIFHSMGHNLVNASITVAAILFITFPANMFNNTFSSNYGEILLILAGWRRRARRALSLGEKTTGNVELPTDHLPALANGGADMPGRSTHTWFFSVLILGSILGGLLNPHFGLNRQSFSGFGATMVAFAIGAGLSWYITKVFRERHRYPTTTYLKALPLGLGVAAICVLISRLTNFEPGYLYGIVVSIAFVESLEDRHNAHLTVISTFSTLCVALLAWFAWVPVNHFALNHSGNIPIAIVDDVLGSIFVGGLVGTVVGLLPLEFMPGGQLLRWRKDVWAIVFFVALFLLVEVELNPASGPTHHGGAPIVTAIVLFIGFGGATWLMRRYFAQRVAAKGSRPALASAPAALNAGDVDPLLDTDTGDDDN